MTDLPPNELSSPASSPALRPPAPPRPRRALRYAAWGLGGTALLLGASAAALTWWLPGWLAPRIEQMGSEALGTPVKLARIELQPLALAARIEGLRIGPEAAPLFQLAEASVELSAQSLWQRLPVVSRLTLRAPELWIQRGETGPYNVQPVLDHLRGWQAKQPPSPPSAEPARYALHNLRLEGGRIHYLDAPLGQRHEVQALTIGLPFLSNLPSDVAIDVQPQLDATVDGSTLRLGGQARPFAAQHPATLALRWQGLPLAPLASLLKAALPPEQAIDLQQGTLDSDLQIAFETRPAPQPPRLQVTGRLALHGLQAQAAPLDSRLRWQALTLDGLDLAPLEQRYAVKTVQIDGLDGELTLCGAKSATAAAPPPAVQATPAAAAASAAPAAPARAPLVALIDTLRCVACRVAVTDRSVQPATRIELQQTELTLSKLSADLGQPIGVTLQTRLATSAGSQTPAIGQLDLQGQVRARPLDVQATLKLAGIDLRVAQPYLAPQLNLVLAGGQLDAEGRLELAQPADAPKAPLAAHYAGRLAVGGLRTLDSVNGADFVAWQRLGFDGLDLAWQANALKANLGRIGLNGLNARLILHPDGHLNVADIARRSPQAAPQSITTPRTAAAKAAPAASTPVATSAAASPHQIRWQAIALRDGAVHFSDTFIKPNYSARLTRLQGSVSALSSSTPQPADVKIAGALDDGAPLSIGGRIHPLGARLFTDIEASARGIALTRLSTYAERYAGYAIEKGSLSVKLQYKIDQGRLEAQNQLFLDQLTFGNPVESAEATKLPVLLAVSLLKNRRGEIDLHLPVAGTLDDPQFSVGGIVWKLLLNLLEKAVTAPFALLMGGDSGETAQIDFAPGSAELSPAARERLDALAAKLTDRPGLKLEATGHADAQRDGAALQASTNRPAAAAASAPTPARAGSAAAPTVPTADIAPALQALADRRADAVMAHLGATLPPERILITRSVVDATTAPAAADTAASAVGPGSTVQFKLR
ncbi:DUF748 domain-containing protein [Sphaerotilus microaerophilus]|uniref:OmpA-like domain-containing protein n=1 Tax=Sphaerotilus microaerophilus TaxID=2914710 RepID=A0ABM7YKQ0_9BURK|nr:DUF748 domain-containing protein [Sphaerotilus sp. FB-5]BDI05013.1 hypothetical protein CATMQ487_19830 [Sphaerotilus sp. FB-5]